MVEGLGAQLLYRSHSGFEGALADVDCERITGIRAELIRDIWDPDTCPIDLLPYLAWAMGVEYWDDNWRESTKRNWVAYQLTFKSVRGTARALYDIINYAGRDISANGYTLDKITTRPQQVFSGPSLTKEQREDWLKRLPQVRTWRMRESGIAAPKKSFYSSSSQFHLRLHNHRFCFGGAFSVPSTAIERLKRRARWVVNNVEQNVTVTDFGSYFQLHRSGVAGRRVFSNRTFNRRSCYIPSDAWKRLITIEPTPRLPWRGASTPTLQAVVSEPEIVKVPGLRKHSVFNNTPMRGFFVPTSAPFRLFQRFPVLDPDIRPFRRHPCQFMGTGRYGFPPFTAWLDVSVYNKVCPWAAGFGFHKPRLKFWVPHDDRPMARVRLAVRSAKSLRDKILIRMNRRMQFVAGRTPVLAGIDTIIANPN